MLQLFLKAIPCPYYIYNHILITFCHHIFLSSIQFFGHSYKQNYWLSFLLELKLQKHSIYKGKVCVKFCILKICLYKKLNFFCNDFVQKLNLFFWFYKEWKQKSRINYLNLMFFYRYLTQIRNIINLNLILYILHS